MNPSKALKLYIQELGKSDICDSLDGMLYSMFDFYRKVRFEGCDFDHDGDMLLFQWHIHDENEYVKNFEMDITRQLVVDSGDDYDEMFQLNVKTSYELTDNLAALGSGNKWCHDLDELEGFISYIKSHESYKATSSLEFGGLVMSYGGV